MTLQVDVYGILPKCGGGIAKGGVVGWDVSSNYSDALDGSGKLTLVVPDFDPALSLLTHRSICRLIDLPFQGTAVSLGEWRVSRITRSTDSPTMVVEADPLLFDLGDVMISQTISGPNPVPSYALSFADLTDQEYFTNVIQPALIAKGYTWINAGTFGSTVRRSRSWNRWTCLQLAQDLVAKSDLNLALRQNGDTDYKFDVVERNASAPSPVVLVGRNVEVLRWTSEGALHATTIVPSGVVPSTESDGRGPEEYAAKITAVGAADITIADPDGNTGPLYYDNQDLNLYAEVMIPPIRVRDESGGANPMTAFTVTGCCLRSTGSTRQLWVAGQLGSGNAHLICYDAKTRAYVTKLDLAQAGPPKGIIYHPGQDRIFVAHPTAGKLIAVTPATPAIHTTLTVQNSGYLAHATAADKLYLTDSVGGTLQAINPATPALGASITLGVAPQDVCYDSTNARIVASHNGAGASINLSFVNPSTDTVANTLSFGLSAVGVTGLDFCDGPARLYVACTGDSVVKVVNGAGTPAVTGTLSGFSSPTWVWSDQVNDQVYIIGTTTAVLIRGSDNAVLASGVYIGESILNPGHPGTDLVTEQGYFWVPLAKHIRPVNTTTLGLQLRRQITSSTKLTQKLGLATIVPIQPNDLVSFRTNTGYTGGGLLRTEITHPTKVTTYGQLARPLRSDQWRGERNYALNPYGDVAGTDDQLIPNWDGSALGVVQPGLRVHAFDAGTWTSFAAQADGAQAGGNTINLKAMTVGHVLQVGTYLATLSRFVARRVVVDGAGKATVSVYPSAWTGSVTDGQTITLERSTIGATTLAGGSSGGSVMLCQNNQPELGLDVPMPYFTGRSLAWFGVKLYAWRYSAFVPNNLKFDVKRQATILQTTQPTDTTSYSDKGLIDYELWQGPFTLNTPCDYISLRIADRTGTATAAIYVSHFMAIIGGEGNLKPFRVNASQGELYHSAQRAVRDLSDPPIAFEASIVEDDPTMPFLVGGRVLLEHPAGGITQATPKVIAIQKPLTARGATTEEWQPVMTLDNRPQSLIRTLAEAGIG